MGLGLVDYGCIITCVLEHVIESLFQIVWCSLLKVEAPMFYICTHGILPCVPLFAVRMLLPGSVRPQVVTGGLDMTT